MLRATSLFFFLALNSFWVSSADLPSAASFWVPSLPDIHQDPVRPLNIYAGHLPSDPKASQASSKDVTAHLYFVLVKARRNADKERVIFWFNGGPGCSSFDGLMMEVGPWRMDGKGGFNVTDGGWEEYTNMVFVDQPAGTGFSYTSTNHYVHTFDEAALQLVEFMRNFYKVFPEYHRMDTYLGGESFAGQWIPYFANGILDSNLGIALKGAAIGNGWLDARTQYPAYIDYAVKVGILEENSELWKVAKKNTDECVANMATIKPPNPEPINVNACRSLLLDVGKAKNIMVNGKSRCINVYDVRYDDTMPSCGMNWPPDIHPITTYLDRPEVVRALHAEAHPESWVECRPRIHQELRETELNSSITVLPKLLSRIPVLIFAGDQDLICNYVGQEAMIKAMTWNGAKGLGTVETKQWSVGGVPAGTWVSSRNLTYAKIFNASHMAPFDMPHVTHDMILRFMGVNFSAIVDGTGRLPSSLGGVSKPMFLDASQQTQAVTPGKTPQQDKAMWEAYYNAGSSAVVLALVFLVIGLFLWCRIRRKRTASLRLPVQNDEESIPLNPRDDESGGRQRKGKQRDSRETGPPIFDVGDGSDDDEEGYRQQQYKDNNNRHQQD
ncbi:Alpha/Beta hydrolase protein [Mycena floridula]|nr:Alpha/Beta hydrolase protein [Mycena floridula]